MNWLARIVFTGSLLGDLPDSCKTAVDSIHAEYNASMFSAMYDRMDEAARSRMSREQWAEYYDNVRRHHGRFLRELSRGFSMSPTSLTTAKIEVWVTSEFEFGAKKERIQLIASLFDHPRLIRYEVQDMGEEPRRGE